MFGPTKNDCVVGSMGAKDNVGTRCCNVKQFNSLLDRSKVFLLLIFSNCIKISKENQFMVCGSLQTLGDSHVHILGNQTGKKLVIIDYI